MSSVADNWRARHLSRNPRCERCAVSGRIVEATTVADREKLGSNGERFESVCEVCYRNDRMAIEAIEHARRAYHVERRLLSAGMSYPHEMWNAAAEFGIDHESFADPRHRKLFDVLCAAVVADVAPTPWVIAEAMKALRYPFLHDELRDLWLLETVPTGLAVSASQLRFYSARRRQYRSLLGEASDIIADLAPDATTLTLARQEVAA